jgi:uncharacterized caspase-like protein
MKKFGGATLLCLAAVILVTTLVPRFAQAAELRFALVIGNDEYKSAKLATPANDAGLVADALTAAGFAVTGARNLDQAALRESLREFLGQVAAAGPDAVALVYLSGFGVQFAGENYFVPVDADLARAADVPLQAMRVSDFTEPPAALPGRVKIVILDAARQNSFVRSGEPLASGLALVDPAGGMAIAFNAAPGTVAADEPGPYGAYATSLVEMIAAGGLSLDDVFTRVRLRVSELTSGAEVPWNASRIAGPFFFTARAAGAPPPPSVVAVADLRARPMRDYATVEDAYAAALALDSLEGYEQFLTLYPSGPFSYRIAAMLAVRREEMIWRRSVFNNTPPAYWSYLRRYPQGPHAWDARRRLAMAGASFDPPPNFVMFDFGIRPPSADELIFVDRPMMIFFGPGYGPPPRPPVVFLPPRPREFEGLPPPPPSHERFSLPTPHTAAVPAFVRPPSSVAPPAGAPSGAAAGRRPVALPAAISHGAPSAAGSPAEGPHGHPAGAPPSPPPPSTAAVKPAPPPPSPPPGPAPATIKPAAPPPPPPHPPAPPPTPAAVKPAPPPPPPPPQHPPAPVPTAAKPPPPPPAPAKPGCPPGKTAAVVNGHPACK